MAKEVGSILKGKTYSIFPDVEERLGYKCVSTNHYVTQFLTGHGDFAKKLVKFGIRRTAICACGEEQEIATTCCCIVGCSRKSGCNFGGNVKKTR